MRKFLAAVIQTDSQSNKAENMKAACEFIDQAARRGAKLVALPEAVNFVGGPISHVDMSEDIPGYTTGILSAKAREHGIFINGGSITQRREGDTRAYNTSVMFDDKGEIIATYRKLHTFDITIPGGAVNRESDHIYPGSEIVTVDTALGKMGMSICYDIRFGEMYRIMALEGAQIIFTPANFTLPTGKDHWEPILRTRAIENTCYVIAPGQIGTKPHFTSYGNSMIIDPWGQVIARVSNRPGIALAEIDLDYLNEIRASLPSLKNRRDDVYEVRRK